MAAIQIARNGGGATDAAQLREKLTRARVCQANKTRATDLHGADLSWLHNRMVHIAGAALGKDPSCESVMNGRDIGRLRKSVTVKSVVESLVVCEPGPSEGAIRWGQWDY